MSETLTPCAAARAAHATRRGPAGAQRHRLRCPRSRFRSSSRPRPGPYSRDTGRGNSREGGGGQRFRSSSRPRPGPLAPPRRPPRRARPCGLGRRGACPRAATRPERGGAGGRAAQMADNVFTAPPPPPPYCCPYRVPTVHSLPPSLADGGQPFHRRLCRRASLQHLLPLAPPPRPAPPRPAPPRPAERRARRYREFAASGWNWFDMARPPPPPLPYLSPYRSPYCMPVAPRHELVRYGAPLPLEPFSRRWNPFSVEPLAHSRRLTRARDAAGGGGQLGGIHPGQELDPRARALPRPALQPPPPLPAAAGCPPSSLGGAGSRRTCSASIFCAWCACSRSPPCPNPTCAPQRGACIAPSGG